MFRFTIRDVLWLMVAVGLAVLWQMELRERRRVNSREWVFENECLRSQNADLHEKLNRAEFRWEKEREYTRILYGAFDTLAKRYGGSVPVPPPEDSGI